MPKISEERRAERRAQILDAARRCFQAEGLHATGMDDIVRASGLSSGAVYGYFAGKDELIVATVVSALQGLRDLFAPMLAGRLPDTPDALVLDILERIDGFSVRDGFDFRRIALLGWAEAQRNDRVRAIYQEAYGEFRGNLAGIVEAWQGRGLIGGDQGADEMADALFAVILGYVVESTVLGGVTPRRIASGLRGLGQSRENGPPEGS